MSKPKVSALGRCCEVPQAIENSFAVNPQWIITAFLAFSGEGVIAVQYRIVSADSSHSYFSRALPLLAYQINLKECSDICEVTHVKYFRWKRCRETKTEGTSCVWTAVVH